MKFEDILPFLREGKKVRRACWCDEDYMQLIINQFGCYEFVFRFAPFEKVLHKNLTAYGMMAEDWEVYNEQN